MIEPRFIHLRVHSDYSMVNGLAKIDQLLKKAVDLNMPALAITDFMNLCGLIKFYNLAHRLGIKPIIGADFNILNESMKNEFTQLTILAANNIGYKNLILLISRAYQQGYDLKIGPFIDRKWLIELREGLILLSGGRYGDIGRALLKGNRLLLDNHLDFYQKYFSNFFYLELLRTNRSNEENYLCAALDLSSSRGIPVVATNEVLFLEKEDFYAHEVRVSIQNGYTLYDSRRLQNYSIMQYMRTEKEMCRLFKDIPEALVNTVEIAKRCNVSLNFGEYFLPRFKTGHMLPEDFLIMKSREGLEKRLNFLFPNGLISQEQRSKYDKRLNHELNVINRMGFSGYFLIVMEFIQWSKDHGIPVGPGRGSGAGSLVAYSLKITDLDPLEFDLLFERFLNLERISMPDFDIDFCMEKRDQVIEHVANIYGREAVAQIITFGTMAAKAVIRDVGRVLGHPYTFVDRIAKLIPFDPGITLESAFSLVPKLTELYERNEEVRILIDVARKLEGVIRNVGKHAGGVVIAQRKISDFSPIYCDENGKYPVTQFDKNDVEFTGLVKFDFLGLKTLTVINLVLKMINRYRIRQGQSCIDISILPLNDEKSFKTLQRAETTAVFQLESRGMKDLIRRLKPDCFEDIIALVALFRPGPLKSGMVDNFINRKHGREKIYYPDIKWQHESLKSILKSTYGIILYQEQVMQIAQIISGYTLESADILRRAMSKKDPEEMAKQRLIFKNGAKKLCIDSELSMRIFDLVEKFAGYGFNKSHSAAYALLSYQTLWLKTHYPAEFMAAVMTADIDNTEKLVVLVDECLRMGLKVLLPSINLSYYYFHVNDKKNIVYGLGAIKGVGKSLVDSIIKVRRLGGNFCSLMDFCVRMSNEKINIKIVEKLIFSGVFDCFSIHRAVLLSSLPDIMKRAHQHFKATFVGQIDMFGVLPKNLEKFEKTFRISNILSEQVLLDKERENLGFYLSGHPIDQYLEEISYYVRGLRLKDISAFSDSSEIICVAGLLISARIVINKYGKKIAICTLDDCSARIEVLLFSSVLNKYQNFLEKDRILIVGGRVTIDNFDGNPKIIVSEIMDIYKAREKYAKGLSIFITKSQIRDDLLYKLRKFLEDFQSGILPLHLYYYNSKARVRLSFRKKLNILPTNDLINNLRSLLGSKQVKFEFY